MLLSLATVIFCIRFIYQRFNARTSALKPNILVISVCSLRQDMVPFMNPAAKDFMPKVAEFFGQGSFVFPNAVNGLGWTALFSVTAPRLKTTWFDSVGYRLAGLWIKNHMYLIPMRNSWTVSEAEARKGLAPDSNFEKHYKESLEGLFNLIDTKNPTPYFIVAQLKYPHFPLIDRYNSDAQWDRYLEPAEKKLVGKYLAHPARYPQKLPFMLMLTNDHKMLHAHPQIEAAINKAKGDGTHEEAFLGLLNSPKILADWTASAGYGADLIILKKIYRANVLYTDGIVGKMLERLKQSGQLDHTVVIFTGDHGEVHMERGHLTHGTSWLDPALRIPLLVRMPTQGHSETVEAQTSFYSLAKLIRDIAEGHINTANFSSRMKEHEEPLLIARDCSNTWRALRESNRWKYAVDNATGESFVFDLQRDPGELHDLAPTNPSRVADLEKKYWEALPKFNDQMVNSCEPWAGAPHNKQEP